MPYKSIRALMAVILTLLTACSVFGSDDSGFRVFDDAQRKQIEEQSELPETLNEHDYDSQIEAFVRNGYRAVGVENEEVGNYAEGDSTGTVLFAQCKKDQAFEECSRSTPSVQGPHAYVYAGWTRGSDGRISVDLAGEVHWRAKVKETTLDCVGYLFRLNPYSIKQIPVALSNFVKNGEARTGNLEVKLPPNPDPKGDPGMGQGSEGVEPVLWVCNTL